MSLCQSEVEVSLAPSAAGDDRFVPTRPHGRDAGADLRIAGDLVIPSHGTATVGAGVSLRLARGVVGLLLPRAGMSAARGVSLANGVGLIAPGCEDEVALTLFNLTDGPIELSRGERVAQLVLVPYYMASFSLAGGIEPGRRPVSDE